MAKANTGPATAGLTEDGLHWQETQFEGTTYRLREITVDEADASWDAARNPDNTFNVRLQTRIALCSAIISPPTALDELGKWQNRKLGHLLGIYDELNNLPAASAEGESSPPAS